MNGIVIKSIDKARIVIIRKFQSLKARFSLGYRVMEGRCR